MFLNAPFRHGDGEIYTAREIGPMGTGRFFGRQVVHLERADGTRWIATTKNGRLHPSKKLTPAK